MTNLPKGNIKLALEILSELTRPIDVKCLSAHLVDRGAYKNIKPECHIRRTNVLITQLHTAGLVIRSGRKQSFHYVINVARYQALIDGVQRHVVPANSIKLDIPKQTWFSGLGELA